MKVFLLWLFIVLGVAQTMMAQTRTIDLATYVPPRGWSESQTNGVLLIQDHKTVQGRTQFCQIYLFPNQPSNADAVANFQKEWEEKVARPLGFTGRSTAKPEAETNGWTPLVDHVNTIFQGAPLRVILPTATGFGRYMSVVISVSPNSYQDELEAFFRDLNFHAPGGDNPLPLPGRPPNPQAHETPNPNPGPSAAGSLANYVYTLPDGWARQELSDRITLISPRYSAGDSCQLTLLPLRPFSQPLDQDAIGAFRAIFNADPMTNYPSSWPKMAKGKSVQGWEYFMMRKLVGGQEGEARTTGATLFVARLGDQVATIVGVSRDFLLSSCFGELHGDAWPKFFYSLQFKNAASGPDPAAIRQRLAGSWITAPATAGLAYTFQANGRYADTLATAYRTRVSSSEVLQTTTGFFGDGAYSIDGNTLVLKRDDNKRFTFYFRLEQVSKDGGNTWADQLWLMEPGATGEFSLRRN